MGEEGHALFYVFKASLWLQRGQKKIRNQEPIAKIQAKHDGGLDYGGRCESHKINVCLIQVVALIMACIVCIINMLLRWVFPASVSGNGREGGGRDGLRLPRRQNITDGKT